MARKSRNSRKSEEGDWHLPTQKRNSSVKKVNEVNKGGLINEDEIIYPNINDNKKESYRDKLLGGQNPNDDIDMIISVSNSFQPILGIIGLEYLFYAELLQKQR